MTEAPEGSDDIHKIQNPCDKDQSVSYDKEVFNLKSCVFSESWPEYWFTDPIKYFLHHQLFSVIAAVTVHVRTRQPGQTTRFQNVSRDERSIHYIHSIRISLLLHILVEALHLNYFVIFCIWEITWSIDWYGQAASL